MIFENPYFTALEKIELLQKWILVHSYLYYQLDKSIVTDYMYDMNCKQLAELMEANKKVAKKARYRKCFDGFDGSTGFHLVHRLAEGERARLGFFAKGLVEKYGG